MDFGNIITQAGLLQRDTQDYDRQQRADQLDVAQKAIQMQEAEFAKSQLPQAQELSKADMQEKMQTAKEKQAANIWNLYRMSDRQGALDALNKSNILAPGKQFTKIEAGKVPSPDGSGNTLNVIALHPADGGAPVMLSTNALETLAQKYGTTYEKVGNNLLKRDRFGNVTPVYEQEQYTANPETGAIYSKRTGKPPEGAPAAAVGIGAPGTKAGNRMDEHVQRGLAVVKSAYGADSLSGIQPDTMPTYLMASRLTEQYIRKNGMDPAQAAAKAQKDAEQMIKSGATPDDNTPGTPTPGAPAAGKRWDVNTRTWVTPGQTAPAAKTPIPALPPFATPPFNPAPDANAAPAAAAGVSAPKPAPTATVVSQPPTVPASEGIKGTPVPQFENTPQGDAARVSYQKAVDQTAQKVEQAYRRGVIGSVDTNTLKLSLNSSDISNHTRQQIRNELARRGQATMVAAKR